MLEVCRRLSTEEKCTINTIIAEKKLGKSYNKEEIIIEAYRDYICDMEKNSAEEYQVLYESTVHRYQTEQSFTQADIQFIMGTTWKKVRNVLTRFNLTGKLLLLPKRFPLSLSFSPSLFFFSLSCVHVRMKKFYTVRS